MMDAVQDFVGRHAVAGHFAIIKAQTAVAAKADAVVGNLDQAPQMDLAPDRLLADQVRPPPKLLQPGLAAFAQPGNDLGSRHGGKGEFHASIHSLPPTFWMRSTVRQE